MKASEKIIKTIGSDRIFGDIGGADFGEGMGAA